MKRKKWNAKRFSAIALSLALILPGNIVFAEEAGTTLPEGVTVQPEIPESDEIDSFADFAEAEPEEEIDESTSVDEMELPKVTESGDRTQDPEEEVADEENEVSEAPGEVFPGEAEDSDEIIVYSSSSVQFTLNRGEAIVTGYSGSDPDLVIPTSVPLSVGSSTSYYPVTTIGAGAFTYNRTIRSVTIPGCVTEIRASAFSGCTALTNVTLEEGIQSIGMGAFANCPALKSIVVPSTVTSMGTEVFYNCTAMKTAEIKNKIVYSKEFAGNISLQTVKFSDTVQTINEKAFENCKSLKDLTLPKGLTTLGDYAFRGCTSLAAIDVPSAIIISTKAGTGVFSGCTGLKTVNYHASVVGPNMFENCTGIESITLSSSVINDYAFKGCTSLKNIKFPSGAFQLRNYVFQDCDGLTSITVPSGMNGGMGAFYGCANLKTAEIYSSTVPIFMFRDNINLVKVTMGSNVQSVGSSAFEGCTKLADVTFGSKLATVGSYAFHDCEALETVNLPDMVATIEEGAFYSCGSLQSVVIPGSVSTVGSSAFAFAPKLISVTIGDGVISLGDEVFRNAGKLDSVYIPTSVISIGKNVFINTALGSGVVYCEQYSTADNASYYPAGTTIRYGRPKISPPAFTVKGVFGGRDVTFTSETKGAVIYYSTSTSNLTTSDTRIVNGDTVRFEDYYGTLYARAYYNGEWSNVSRLVLKIPVVNDPTITQNGSKVTIRCSTPDSYVYYTLDGSTPSMTNGIKIAPNSYASFELTGGTVKAIAVRSCFTSSKVVEKKITSSVSSSVKTPSFKVVGVFGGRDVTFTSESGATIYYSSTTSSLTTSDAHVKSGGKVTFEDFYGTIYARSYKDGKWSNPARLILKIPVVNKPTITSSEGGYVTIKTTTPGCRIIYTTDGSTPSLTNGKVIYSSASKVYVGTGKTVKAIAVRSCFTNSDVAIYNR